MAGRKGGHAAVAAVADPADRALRAAQECRAATRDAHEVLQGIIGAVADARTLLADTRALIADAERFTLAHVAEAVPAEVKRQLDALQPVVQAAMRDAVDKVGAEFDRLEKLFLGTDNPDGKASLEELALAFRDREQEQTGLFCPHCGNAGYQEPVGDDKDLRPQASGRSVSLCGNCLKPSIFIAGPLPGDLALRKPTPVETAQLAKENKRAVRLVRQRTGDPE